MDKWIYFQKNDNLYVAKVFHDRKEYYIGGFKKKEDAIKARDKAHKDILAGQTNKYRSRLNSRKRNEVNDIETAFNASYMDDPEYRLRYALLMLSLSDVCKSSDHPEYNKSRNWILGKTTSAKTFSFNEICELFHLNPNAVRERVLSNNEETKEKLQQIFN